MNSSLWANLHGGVTHFPIAMIITSFLFDGLAFSLNRERYKRDFHVVGFYTLLLGALASFLAVLSGFVIAAWTFLGSGTLGRHHEFLWPAFGLTIGLAVWRLIVRDKYSQLAFSLYLGVVLIAAILMAIAGYYGGELLGGGG